MIDAHGVVRDLSAHVPDIGPATLDPDTLSRLCALDPAHLPVVDGGARLGPPVAQPGNILCIGLNYRDHVREAGMALPNEPVVFSKHTSALSGPFDPIRMPRGSTRTDWEVELAVVIGRRACGVREEAALDHVAGYTICNDVSERLFQIERGGQWIKGKSAETFCPLGPVLVTADAITDPQALDLWLSVNGETMQRGTTADMVFPVAHLVSYLSTFMTLLPGDVIATGTPAGTGMGRGTYLRRGDVMRMGITGIGEMEQRVA